MDQATPAAQTTTARDGDAVVAAASSAASTTDNDDVQILDQPGIRCVPFAVELSSSTIQGFDEPESSTRKVSALVGNNGVVGTILFLNNSIIVWVGWGKVDTTSTSSSSTTSTAAASAVIGSGIPEMGPLVVAMPRTSYRGAVGNTSCGGSSSKEPSTSTLIGSDTTEDSLLASQMSSRLSLKSGRAVLVSCQLLQQQHHQLQLQQEMAGMGMGIADDNDWSAGLNHDMISHKAAALAEKEIWRILSSLDT